MNYSIKYGLLTRVLKSNGHTRHCEVKETNSIFVAFATGFEV